MTDDERYTQIDTKIAAHRALYLTAVWAGHDGEAQAHEAEVDRLLEFRTYCQRHPGRLTTAS